MFPREHGEGVWWSLLGEMGWETCKGKKKPEEEVKAVLLQPCTEGFGSPSWSPEEAEAAGQGQVVPGGESRLCGGSTAPA